MPNDGADASPNAQSNDFGALVERGVNLVELAAKSAVFSAAQQPVDGLFQLVGAKAPHLFDGPKQYEFNTPEWYASTVGHGAGFMVPFLATSKLTGLVIKNGGISKAMFDGALSGFVFTPTAEGENALAGRGLSAFNSGVMFGAQHFGAQQLSSRLMGAAAERPLVAQTLAMTGVPTATRLGINTLSGTGAGLLSLEASSVISGHGLVTDHQTLVENAVAAAATGFALDGMNVVLARRGTQGVPREGIATEELAAAGAGRMPAPPGLAAEVGVAPLRTVEMTPSVVPHDSVLMVEPHQQIGEWTDPTSGLRGSRQYKSDSGRTFWQSPDGRIFYETPDGTDGAIIDRIWSPYGSNRPAAYTGAHDSGMGHQIFVRDEPQGFYLSHDGRIDKPELYNLYTDAKTADSRTPLPPDLARSLAVLPRMFESDRYAAARLLPAEDGKPYESMELTVRVPLGEKPPEGITTTDYINNYTVDQTVPGRKYTILSADHTVLANSLADQFSAGKISESAYKQEILRLRESGTSLTIPEDYATKLDTVRDLRKVATLAPENEPALREEILKARRDLFLSAYSDRLLPEHWGQFLDVLPNRKLVRELQLLDTNDPDGPNNTTIADTTFANGRIRFFNEHNGVQQHVRRTLLHEWAHTAEEAQPLLRDAYETATQMEPFVGREYGGKNFHENWSVHFAEMLMDPNPEVFLTVAQKAPLRTAILGEVLRRELYASKEHTSLDHVELQTRLDYIDEHVIPQAKKTLGSDFNSVELADITKAAQFIDKLMESKSPDDRALLDKILDRDLLVRTIDEPMELIRSGDWNPSRAARILVRTELLLHLDPEAAVKRSDEAVGVNARLRGELSRMLHSDDPAVIAQALSIGDPLAPVPQGSPVFHRLFTFEDLAAVSNRTSDQPVADQAFAMARRAFPVERVRQLSLQMLQSDSAARESAATFLIFDSDTPSVMSAMNTMRNQVKAGDFRSLGAKSIEQLNSELDMFAADIIDGSVTKVDLCARILARARLLRDLVEAKPELNDVHMQARMRRATALEESVARLFAAKRDGSDQDKSDLNDLMNAIPPGTFSIP